MLHRPPNARTARLRARGVDLSVTIVSVAAAAWLLIATLPGIDMGGDAAWKWAFVRGWDHGLPWVFDHHTARFTVNLPIYLTQRLLGTQVNVMYVAPLCMALLQVAALYACGRLLASRGVGIAAVATLLAFEPWTMAASRLLPGVFQTTYLVLALYGYARFANEKRRGWLLWLGACVLLAYEAMITTLYFVPGFVLAVWHLRRRWLDNGLWLAVLLAGMAIETAGYAWLSEFPLGRLQIIQRSHSNVAPLELAGLFRRYAVLPLTWQLALGAGAGCACLLPWLSRSRPLHGLCMLIATVLLATTFGVKQLDPLVPALNFRARYFDPLAPLLALAVLACAQRGWIALRALHQRCLRSGAAGATAAAYTSSTRTRLTRTAPRGMLVLACAAVLSEAGALAQHRGYTGPEQLRLNARQQRTLSEAYVQGTPIVGRNARDHDQKKTLTVVSFAFFSDRAFWLQPNPHKPRLYRTKVRRRSYRYLARPSSSAEHIARDIARAQCVVFAARLSPEQGLSVQTADAGNCR